MYKLLQKVVIILLAMRLSLLFMPHYPQLGNYRGIIGRFGITFRPVGGAMSHFHINGIGQWDLQQTHSGSH